jgi:outer membrane immunogenic protein
MQIGAWLHRVSDLVVSLSSWQTPNLQVHSKAGNRHVIKRILLAIALSLIPASFVLAADLPPPDMPLPARMPPPRAPATYIPSTAPVLYNWGGMYFGINGGYGFGSGNFGGSEWTFPAGSALCAAGCTTGAFGANGGIVGSTFGANFQSGEFVMGLEADIDWSDIYGSASSTASGCPSCKTTNDWLATIRLRAGLAFDRVFLFATGGGAFGDIKSSLPASLGGGINDSTEFGWAAGAGIEAALAQNWTGKLEYLYVDLSNGSCSTACFSPPGPAAAVSFSTSLVRGGINYKFGF